MSVKPEAAQDRRRDARFGQPVIARLRAVLRPGHSVALVDLSAGGALVRTPRPLRPGSRVHVRLQCDGHAMAMPAHVLRCAVASIGSHGVRYLGALKFDHRCETLWAAGTHAGYVVPGQSDVSAPGEGHSLPDPFGNHVEVLT